MNTTAAHKHMQVVLLHHMKNVRESILNITHCCITNVRHKQSFSFPSSVSLVSLSKLPTMAMLYFHLTMLPVTSHSSCSLLSISTALPQGVFWQLLHLLYLAVTIPTIITVFIQIETRASISFVTFFTRPLNRASLYSGPGLYFYSFIRACMRWGTQRLHWRRGSYQMS